MKAWELERQITDNAVPKLLSEEEQTWEAQFEVGASEDFHMKLLWESNVPGSYAPESIMLAAIQSKENLGYIVDNGVELYEQGLEALKNDDMVRLNMITTELWHAVNHARKDERAPSWKFRQYHDWESFRSDAVFPARMPVAKDRLEQQMYAGWMAQIIGGAVGTMVEGYTTDKIRETFGEVRNYLRKPSTYNDDITYELAFLYAYEEKGKAITSADVAKAWIGYVPSGWSAEEMALRNIRWGIMPPDSGLVDNPFGEWIGAQMRGAICGMLAPGNPEEAARLAWLDGEVSHFNNGIIGEVFNAVLVSLSYVEKDIRKIVRQCVEMIPGQCEYRSVVQFALDACLESDGWEPAWRMCEKRFAQYNWIHAYPNAAAEVAALWFGGCDFDETAHIISMEGQDVDCSAAQILTAIGIIVGIDGIRDEWKEPIGDELKTYLRKYRTLSIKELAKQTAAAADV
ncbi:MAG TPA: ADP-ribosylglycohydrolase family protein [Anaerovoracaceae bacterium]|nr:ADP-ribosylglycohydrolase family protein [Anaerovoracaceae bacterium]